MTVTLPETLQYGKVVGRFVLAVADVPEDPDVLPNAVPAVGTVSFTSMNPLTKETAATPPTTVVRSVISAAIDNNGYLYNPKDPTGPRGIWLVAGPYKVAYALNTGAIAGHSILVLPTHNDANPLDLISALPPGGPILTASQYAEVSARIDALEVSGGGVELASGTVTLDDIGSPVREFYATGAATINGVAFAAGTAVVWRRTPAGVWGYIIVEPWTDLSATTTTTTTAATTTTTTTTTASGPTIVQFKTAANSTLTLDSVPTPGNLLIVGVGNGVTDPATWTYSHDVAIDVAYENTGWDAVILSGAVASGDSTTVTITGLNAAYGPTLTVWEVAGVSSAISTDTAGGSLGSTSVSTNPLDVTSGALVFAVCVFSGNIVSGSANATGLTRVSNSVRGYSGHAVEPAMPFSTSIAWSTGRAVSAVMAAYS